MKRFLLFFLIINNLPFHAFNKFDIKLPWIYGLTGSFDNVYFKNATSSFIKEPNLTALLKALKEAADIRKKLHFYEQQTFIKRLDNKPAHQHILLRPTKKHKKPVPKNPELIKKLIEDSHVCKKSLIKELNSDFNKAILNYRIVSRNHIPLIMGIFHNLKLDITNQFDTQILKPLESLFHSKIVMGENENYFTFHHKEWMSCMYNQAVTSYKEFLSSIPALLEETDQKLKEKNDARKKIKADRKQKTKEARDFELTIQEAESQKNIEKTEKNPSVWDQFSGFVWGAKSKNSDSPKGLEVVLDKTSVTPPHQRNMKLSLSTKVL